MNLTDLHRTFHPKATTYMFFSSKYVTFSGIDQMLGHNRNLNKFKKTEIQSGIFSHIIE